jgi:type I restriction enzyme, S subunit
MSSERVKYKYSVVDRRGGSDQPPLLAVSIHHGVVRRDTLTDDLPRAEDLSNYKLCERGDIVLNRMRAFQGAIGISPQRGLVSPDYAVLRPALDVDARYLHHLFRSSWFVGEMVSRLRGIGNTENGTVRTPRINPEDLGDIPVDFPSLDEQRRIADFLNAETVRIDTLIAARRAQSAKLGELWDSRLAAAISEQAGKHGWIPLRRLVTSLEQGWSPQCDDAIAEPDEWAVLKTSAVSSGEFRLMEHKRLPANIEPDTRYQIRDGDILMTRGSGSADHVGMAALAETGDHRLLLSDLLYRIRIERDWSPVFVTLALHSQPVRGLMALLLRGQSGQTIKLRSQDVRSIEVPAIPAVLQAKIAAELSAERTAIRNASQGIEASLSLLAERRQALITAAVTGGITV